MKRATSARQRVLDTFPATEVVRYFFSIVTPGRVLFNRPKFLLLITLLVFTLAGSASASIYSESSVNETLSVLGIGQRAQLLVDFPRAPVGVQRYSQAASFFSQCTFIVSSSQQTIPPGGGDTSFFFTTSESGCQIEWTASTNDPWIHIITQSGTASSFPSFMTVRVDANSTPTARAGKIIVNAGGTNYELTINQEPLCSYSLSASSVDIASGGGNGQFTINTTSGCTWAVQSNDSWITVTSSSNGAGSSTVTFTVQPNNGPARTGTITAAGITFTVNQANGCTYVLTPTSAHFQPGGGNGSFTVTTAPGCTWTASTNDSFINITSGQGSGSGTVLFTVQANSGAARSGSISVGGSSFSVTQDSACAFTVAPPSVDYPVAGGSGSITVTAGPGCQWTAVSNDSWIVITAGASGNGNGTVSYSVQPNSGIPRSGSITVAGQTVTITQGNGCNYQLSPTSANVLVEGGTGSFTVTTGAGCPWTAVSNASWIHITSPPDGSGNGTVSYSVDANSAGPRSGTITVGNQSFTINQVSTCTYSIAFETSYGLFPASGGQGRVIVTAPAGCEWSATSNVPWIGFQPTTGSGNGSFTFTVQANNGSTRSGNIIVAGQSLPIVQVGGCSYQVTPQSTDFPARGGSTQFTVTTASDCAWTSGSDVSWIHFTTPISRSGNGSVTFTVDANTGKARSTTIVIGGAVFTVTQRAFITTRADFDGDGKTDPSFYRPSDGTWNLLRSKLGISVGAWGGSSDIPVPGDYDHDSVTDVAVYRPQTGQWFIVRSSDGTALIATWGGASDKPVAADYDGDGSTDIAVYRPQTGEWFVFRSSDGQFDTIQWGASGDIPVPGYYDADNKTDITVYRPASGTWYVLRSTGGGIGVQWGAAADHPVPADYDGDNRDDIAVYRPSDGNWFILRSSDLGATVVAWGANGDIPVPGDYDGDDTDDIAQFRPSNGTWYELRSSSGYGEVVWGGEGDKPIPAFYIP